MTEQANDQTELDALQEHVWAAGREIENAHLRLSGVLLHTVSIHDASDEFKKAAADALDILEELWKIDGAHILFKDEEEENQ